MYNKIVISKMLHMVSLEFPPPPPPPQFIDIFFIQDIKFVLKLRIPGLVSNVIEILVQAASGDMAMTSS